MDEMEIDEAALLKRAKSGFYLQCIGYALIAS